MRKLLLASALLLSVPLFAADDLPRRALFGAQLIPADHGVAIGQLTPGAPAAAAGLQSGDVITAVAGASVAQPAEFAESIRRKGAGRVELSVVRDGHPVTVTVLLSEAPRESSADYDVIYDSAPASGALRRLIVTKPHGTGKHPAVLFAGGIGCYSLDNAPAVVSGYIALIQELTRRGFVVMRVEKSGIGDSQGVPCHLQDFDNELAGYRAGLARLRTYEFVDGERLFIVGHSIGGIVAPVLASESSLRGVVAISTAGQKWLDYEDVNARRQMSMEGKSGAELESRLALRSSCARKLMAEKLAPEAIVAQQPACAEMLKYPAHYTYMQQVAAIDPTAVWKKVAAPVLLVHGASDFVTDVREHKTIERAVNSAHKGHATLIVEPRMDHFMREVASQQESMQSLKGNQLESHPLQARVRSDIIEWLRAQC